MAKGITSREVLDDLEGIAEFYSYGGNGIDGLYIEHYNDEGDVTGTQTLTITVGEFKPVEA